MTPFKSNMKSTSQYQSELWDRCITTPLLECKASHHHSPSVRPVGTGGRGCGRDMSITCSSSPPLTMVFYQKRQCSPRQLKFSKTKSQAQPQAAEITLSDDSHIGISAINISRFAKNILLSHNLLCRFILICTKTIGKLYRVTYLTAQRSYSGLLRPCNLRSNPAARSY